MTIQNVPGQSGPWRIPALLLAGTIMTSAHPALAQNATPQPVGVDPNAIVVTATHRSETLQHVPVSIQAISNIKLEQHQVNDIDDYVKLLPSVSYQTYGPGQTQIFFRGISSGGDGGYGIRGGSLPASGLYIDEIPVTTIGNAVDIHTYDMARVEALSGPQGTLFGASSLAGTLRLITNQPDPDKFSGGYDLTANKFGKGDAGATVEGFVNLPLAKGVAIRLVGFYEHDGGYISNVPSTRTYTLGNNDPSNNITINNSKYVKNNFNDVDTYGGRATLKVEVDDKWSITPAIIYQHQVANGAFLYDPAEGDLKVNDFTPDMNTDHWYQASLTIQGKVGNWDVIYAGGYMNRHIANQADYSYYTVAYDKMPGYTKFADGKGGYLDPTYLYSGSDYITKQTHELRLSSPVDRPLRLLTGLFLQRQTDHAIAHFAINGLAAIPDSPAVPNCGDSLFCTNEQIVDRDYAAFAELSYDIVPNLTLTGGVRAFKYDNSALGFSGYLSDATSGSCYATSQPGLPCISINKDTSGTGETHKINLSWRIDPERMLYATLSTGYRPGGFNRRALVNPFKPDTLDNYEIGWKTSWFNHRLIINGAAFIEEWHNLQYGLAPVGSGGVINIYNAGNAEVKGVEGDATLRPMRGLTLSASGTYIDAKLTTNFCSFDANGNPDCVNGTVAAPAGTPLPIQPKVKFNATVRYEFALGTLKSFAQVAMLHQSSTRSWLTDTEANLLGPTRPFSTFDFSAGISRGS